MSFQKIITIGLWVLGASLLISYVVFQARFFLIGPVLRIDEPHVVVQDSRTIVVSGYAGNIVDISLNGRQVVTDLAGNFAHEVVIPAGYSILEVLAHDRFGREASVQKEVLYDFFQK